MKVSDMSVFVTIILVGLSLFTALLLESRMDSHYLLQLLLIVLAIIFTFGLLFGLWIDEPWAYPLSTILFAALLADVIWLYSSTGAFLVSAFALLVNVAGLVICLASVQRPKTLAAELETYNISAGRRKKK